MVVHQPQWAVSMLLFQIDRAAMLATARRSAVLLVVAALGWVTALWRSPEENKEQRNPGFVRILFFALCSLFFIVFVAAGAPAPAPALAAAGSAFAPRAS